VPAFYSHAKSVDALVNHSAGRVLDLFGVEHDRIKRWQGIKGAAPENGEKGGRG
jgi:3-polyprenyl-4-hydroxybenzoate decarboxylase